MALNIWEKMEEIRRQPEAVRHRYALLCVAVSMAFVVGIWMISTEESFRSASSGVLRTAEDGRQLVPDALPTPSLGEMLKQASPLRVDTGEKMTGEQYFQGQLEARSGTVQEGIPNAANTQPR